MAGWDAPTAGDRYRIEVRKGSIFAGLGGGRKPSKRGPSVAIVNEAGEPVWRRVLASQRDVAQLVRVIEEQVLTAGLADFELWLRTEGAEGAT